MSNGELTAAYDQSMSSSSRMVRKICSETRPETRPDQTRRGWIQKDAQRQQRRFVRVNKGDRGPQATKCAAVGGREKGGGDYRARSYSNEIRHKDRVFPLKRPCGMAGGAVE